jgi:hypothetical protein
LSSRAAGKYRHELVALAHAEEAHKIGLLAFSTQKRTGPVPVWNRATMLRTEARGERREPCVGRGGVCVPVTCQYVLVVVDVKVRVLAACTSW